ncbi:MAG: hypothetical protein ACHREM_06385 [Polyangiales bacterium]
MSSKKSKSRSISNVTPTPTTPQHAVVVDHHLVFGSPITDAELPRSPRIAEKDRAYYVHLTFHTTTEPTTYGEVLMRAVVSALNETITFVHPYSDSRMSCFGSSVVEGYFHSEECIGQIAADWYVADQDRFAETVRRDEARRASAKAEDSR